MVCDAVLRKTLEELYRAHRAALSTLACRFLGNAQDARDVVHEVFTAMLAHAPDTESRAPETLIEWLDGMTRHLCITRLRTRTAQRRMLERESIPWALIDARPVAESRVHAREVLATVPPDLRAIAVSYYLGGMTQNEIAESVGCSRRNVGYQLERVRRCVRDIRRTYSIYGQAGY